MNEAIKQRQVLNDCNQDDNPLDWGVPCCEDCICAAEAVGTKSVLDELREEAAPFMSKTTPLDYFLVSAVDTIRKAELDVDTPVRVFIKTADGGRLHELAYMKAYDVEGHKHLIIACDITDDPVLVLDNMGDPIDK